VVTIPASVLAIDQPHCFFANAYCEPSHFLASRLNGYNPEGRRLSITIILSARNETLDSTIYMQTVTMQGRVSEMSYIQSASNTRIYLSTLLQKLPCQHPHHHQQQQQQSLVYSISIYALWTPIRTPIKKNNAASADKVRVPVHRLAVIGRSIVSTLCLTRPRYKGPDPARYQYHKPKPPRGVIPPVILLALTNCNYTIYNRSPL